MGTPLEQSVDYLQDFPPEYEKRPYYVKPAASAREARIRINAEKRRFRDNLRQTPESPDWTYPCNYWTASYYLSYWLLFGTGDANKTFQKRWWNLYGTEPMIRSTQSAALATKGTQEGKPLMGGMWHSKRLEGWFKPGGRNAIALEHLDYHLSLLGASTAFLDPRGWCAPRPMDNLNPHEAKLRKLESIPQSVADNDDLLLPFLYSTCRTNQKKPAVIESEHDLIMSRYVRIKELSAIEHLRENALLEAVA